MQGSALNPHKLAAGCSVSVHIKDVLSACQPRPQKILFKLQSRALFFFFSFSLRLLSSRGCGLVILRLGYPCAELFPPWVCGLRFVFSARARHAGLGTARVVFLAHLHMQGLVLIFSYTPLFLSMDTLSFLLTTYFTSLLPSLVPFVSLAPCPQRYIHIYT